MSADDIDARLSRLTLPFNAAGYDPFGVSRSHLKIAYTALSFLYRRYFSVKCHGLGNVPATGRAMLIGNHSGGVAVDGAMVLASMFLDHDPPRLAHGMAEKFINQFPVASIWASRCGQFTGLPETCVRLLEDDRLLLVFPEGARGTAKLYKDRNSLVEFGSGFMRLALQTKSPIIPFGFVGGGEAVPTIANLYGLGKLLGVPYVPVTPYLVSLPRPVALEVHYGAPMMFHGTGREDDAVVNRMVDEVKEAIRQLIERGRETRRERLGGSAS